MFFGGVVVAAAALILAFAFVMVSQLAVDGAVAGLARAPGGCTTTLEVSESGSFTVYLESKGDLRDVVGSCPFPAGRFQSQATLSDVTLEAVAVGGSDVRVLSSDGSEYSTDDWIGSEIATLEVTQGGQVLLTVVSDVEGAVLAVGVDPSDVALPWLIAAGSVAVAGGLLGAVLIALGLRRRPAPATNPTNPAPAAPSDPWGPPRV